MGRSFHYIVFASILALSAGAAAQGNDDEARVHFRLGQAYYDSGRFEDAAREFQQAYDMSQRPQLLYNVFIAWRDAAQLDKAIVALEAYLRLVPDARDRASLEARLASMQRLQRQQEAVRAAGGRESETTTPSPAETDAQEGAPAETGEGGTEPAEGGETTVASPARVEPGGGSVLPWVVIGAGAAIAGVSVVTGLMALSAESDLEASCPDNACTAADWQDTRDTGRTLATLTDVLLAVGGVTMAAGVALLFLLDDGGRVERAPATSASAACAADGCAVSVRTSF